MELTDAVLGDVPMIVVAGAVNHSTCEQRQTALHRWLEARVITAERQST
ncbi:MAG: hypothetical protein JW990_07155 [Thermoleophilia bacterium]|nr:hypothetical protein [Thermoleophilia bacterium]